MSGFIWSRLWCCGWLIWFIWWFDCCFHCVGYGLVSVCEMVIQQWYWWVVCLDHWSWWIDSLPHNVPLLRCAHLFCHVCLVIISYLYSRLVSFCLSRASSCLFLTPYIWWRIRVEGVLTVGDFVGWFLVSIIFSYLVVGGWTLLADESFRVAFLLELYY